MFYHRIDNGYQRCQRLGLVFICLVIVERFIMFNVSKVNISLISMLLFACYFAYKCRQDEKLAVVRANKAEAKYEKYIQDNNEVKKIESNIIEAIRNRCN
ncbi:hypothetical protein A9G41_05340 [Gilliamella sp. Nev5-1]|nr:hypothetical protein A9G41_05340 [Gilliamella apicola]